MSLEWSDENGNAAPAALTRWWTVPLWQFACPPAVALLMFAVRSIRNRSRPDRGPCPACGYDPTGNASGTCPECGTPIAKGDEA